MSEQSKAVMDKAEDLMSTYRFHHIHKDAEQEKAHKLRRVYDDASKLNPAVEKLQFGDLSPEYVGKQLVRTLSSKGISVQINKDHSGFKEDHMWGLSQDENADRLMGLAVLDTVKDMTKEIATRSVNHELKAEAAAGEERAALAEASAHYLGNAAIYHDEAVKEAQAAGVQISVSQPHAASESIEVKAQ